MRSLTSFDHYAIAIELNARLIGSYFQKMSVIPNGYKFKLRRGDLVFFLPDKVYLTSYSIEAQQPDRIAQKVRKEISGLKLREVKTLNLDRVMHFDFGERKLTLELFGRGNIVLTDANHVILDVLEPGSWKDRTLRIGVMYNTPPAPPISRGELVSGSFLIRDLIRSGVPKPYAKEIIYRLGEDEKTPTKNVNKDNILDIFDHLIKSLSSPSGFLCEGEPYPIKLSYLPCEKKEESFNAVLDLFTPSLISLQPKQESKKKSKLQYMLESLDELNREITELETALNEIYQHWTVLEEMFRSREFRSVGRLRFRKREGKFVVFDFTP